MILYHFVACGVGQLLAHELVGPVVLLVSGQGGVDTWDDERHDC